jgi:uncharacterized lipoprotein YehR (DUF1307 family)
MIITTSENVQTKWFIGETVDKGEKVFYNLEGSMYYLNLNDKDTTATRITFDTKEEAIDMMHSIYENIKSIKGLKSNISLMVFSVSIAITSTVTLPIDE